MFDLGQAIYRATIAHNGQYDKAGEPYILHPLRVMLSFAPYHHDERIVAVMHDMMEDCAVTVDDLISWDVPQHIMQALVALTHPKNENYESYILRVRENELARTVKIADIHDNTSVERMIRLTRVDQVRLTKKYTNAVRLLGM